MVSLSSVTISDSVTKVQSFFLRTASVKLSKKIINNTDNIDLYLDREIYLTTNILIHLIRITDSDIGNKRYKLQSKKISP